MAKAKVYITPKVGLLDPQGKAIAEALTVLGFQGVRGVHVGKYLEVDLDATGESADALVNDMCQKLLANTVIEAYRYEIER